MVTVGMSFKFLSSAISRIANYGMKGIHVWILNSFSVAESYSTVWPNYKLFTHWFMTFGFLLAFAHYEQGCCKHSYSRFCGCIRFHFPWVDTKGWTCWVIRWIYILFIINCHQSSKMVIMFTFPSRKNVIAICHIWSISWWFLIYFFLMTHSVE